MINLPQNLLPVYVCLTWPWRLWYRKQAAAKGRAPITTLLYHRIASDGATSWTTTRAAFRRHIAWLSRHCELLSLRQAEAQLTTGRNQPRPGVVLTFDDGYADNLRALADLLYLHIPVAYFVTVENIVSSKPFTHDTDVGVRFRPHTPREIRALSEAGLEIGSHGWSHRDFSLLDRRELIWELEQSKKWLEDATGQAITAVAVPFGCQNMITPQVLEAAFSLGYRIVCSAFGGYNIPRREPGHLRRFHGDNSLWRLINRVTVDPRLLRRTLREEPVLVKSVRQPAVTGGGVCVCPFLDCGLSPPVVNP